MDGQVATRRPFTSNGNRFLFASPRLPFPFPMARYFDPTPPVQLSSTPILSRKDQSSDVVVHQDQCLGVLAQFSRLLLLQG